MTAMLLDAHFPRRDIKNSERALNKGWDIDDPTDYRQNNYESFT